MSLATYEHIERQIHRLGRWRVLRAIEIGKKGEPDGIAGTHLLALGSRESNMQNIVGDRGHGRGWLQIDDRYHATWLRSHEGCESGSWLTTPEKTALDPGFCPTFTDACWKAVSILREARVYGRNRGVPEKDLGRFMLAAYNAGPYYALLGYRDGNLDRYTTGGNYSRDVIDRRLLINRCLKDKGLA